MKEFFRVPRGSTPALSDLSPAEELWLKNFGFGEPLYLDDENCTYPNEFCQLNTLIYAMDNPGSEIVSGWTVWHNSQICELEFHVVIRRDGRIFDITNRIDGEKQILFLPDLKHWAKLHDDTVTRFNNIVFPAIGFKREQINCFKASVPGAFTNFPINGSPVLSPQQQTILNLCKADLMK